MIVILAITAVIAVIAACKLAYDIGREDERDIFCKMIETSAAAWRRGYDTGKIDGHTSAMRTLSAQYEAQAEMRQSKRDSKGRFLKRQPQ